MKRWYVTMTWNDWPDQGSYGDIFDAETPEEAEQLCRDAMAEAEVCEGVTLEDIDRSGWYLVDCIDLDNFIRNEFHNRAAAGKPDTLHDMLKEIEELAVRGLDDLGEATTHAGNGIDEDAYPNADKALAAFRQLTGINVKQVNQAVVDELRAQAQAASPALTDWQRTILHTYADGDFAHVNSPDEITGDTLAKFILVETSPSEDCENVDTAIHRLENAAQELQDCIDALRLRDLDGTFTEASPVTLSDTNGSVRWTGPWNHFVIANMDALSAEEMQRARERLEQGHSVDLGGGAAPLMTLRRA